MLPKSILDRAKAYLCWDAVPDLAIQLVPVHGATGFYYPPGNGLHGIVLFYDPGSRDYTEPLFLLFHEAGHSCQWRRMKDAGRECEFSENLDTATGTRKTLFEEEAWSLGEELFRSYLKKNDLDEGLAAAYADYGRRCRETYQE
jgi:hypothetical protein